MTGNSIKTFFKSFKFSKFFMVNKIFFLWKRQRICILILSIRSNGDQMNTLLLILHCSPINTPPSMECNSAMTTMFFFWSFIVELYQVWFKATICFAKMLDISFLRVSINLPSKCWYNFTKWVNYDEDLYR